MANAFDPPSIERLFHGTCEPLEGPLRPGGYDGVLWTAETSTIAQTYIPRSGGSTYVSLSKYQLDERVTPSQTNPLYTIAKMIGPEARDVQYDATGRATSWIVPDGYARNADVVRYIEEVLGYRNRDTIGDFRYELLTNGWNKDTKEHRIVPADFRIPGSLIIVEGFADMRFLDLSRGESDLTDLQYHLLTTFRRAEAEGYHGVVIDDFAQAEPHWGNLGHRSIGFFAHALPALKTTVIPAVRFEFGPNVADLAVTETPEYQEWQTAQAARHAMQFLSQPMPAARRIA